MTADPLEGHPSPTWESAFQGEDPLYNEDGVDLTLIREMLALSPAERVRTMQNALNSLEELRHVAAQRLPANDAAADSASS